MLAGAEGRKHWGILSFFPSGVNHRSFVSFDILLIFALHLQNEKTFSKLARCLIKLIISPLFVFSRFSFPSALQLQNAFSFQILAHSEKNRQPKFRLCRYSPTSWLSSVFRQSLAPLFSPTLSSPRFPPLLPRSSLILTPRDMADNSTSYLCFDRMLCLFSTLERHVSIKRFRKKTIRYLLGKYFQYCEHHVRSWRAQHCSVRLMILHFILPNSLAPM